MRGGVPLAYVFASITLFSRLADSADFVSYLTGAAYTHPTDIADWLIHLYNIPDIADSSALSLYPYLCLSIIYEIAPLYPI